MHVAADQTCTVTATKRVSAEPQSAVTKDVIVSLSGRGRWTVTGTSYLNHALARRDPTVTAPRGGTAMMTVDGKRRSTLQAPVTPEPSSSRPTEFLRLRRVLTRRDSKFTISNERAPADLLGSAERVRRVPKIFAKTTDRRRMVTDKTVA
jgi:hypothetical protein